MDQHLPDSFDVVVVGTGLKESILSGAFSRIGKSVLHLDPNDYYGDDWASFNINSFKEFLDNSNPQLPSQESSYECGENEELFKLRGLRKTISGFVEQRRLQANAQQSSNPAGEGGVQETSIIAEDADDQRHDVAAGEDETDSGWIYNRWRQFNIDIIPKLLFSRGPLVELLIQSNVSRYLEFKVVDQILATLHGTHELVAVPCSQADVFNCNFITLLERRKLMKVLNMALNYEDHSDKYQAFRDKPYREFLKSQRLEAKLQDFFIYSIAMVKDEANTMEGLQATRKFLRSLGRYGNSAFIWPTYGVGEIPQAFSRLSAVFGGLFCLRRSASALVYDKDDHNKCKAIIDNTGQKINCKHVVVNERLMPSDEVQHADDSEVTTSQAKRKCHRATFISDTSIFETGNEHITLGVLSPVDDDNPAVRLIEVGPSGGVCPQGCYVVHALIDDVQQTSTPTHQQLKAAFKRTEKALFPPPSNTNQATRRRCRKLWSAYFSISSDFTVTPAPSSNVHVTTGPDFDLGFDVAVQEARRIFNKIYPEEEFLPRAPDPEEIIFDEDDEGYNTERNSLGVSSTQSTEFNEAQQQQQQQADNAAPAQNPNS